MNFFFSKHYVGNFYKTVLSDLHTLLKFDETLNNDTQIQIEKFVIHQFAEWDNNKPNTFVLNVNLDVISLRLRKLRVDDIKTFRGYFKTFKK